MGLYIENKIYTHCPLHHCCLASNFFAFILFKSSYIFMQKKFLVISHLPG